MTTVQDLQPQRPTQPQKGHSRGHTPSLRNNGAVARAGARACGAILMAAAVR